MQKTTWGIELEFSSIDFDTHEKIKSWIQEKYSQGWELGDDGSVSGHGSELRTIGGKSINEILKEFKGISEYLTKLYKEEKIYVDSSAGFHVHIGIENWTFAELEKFYHGFVKSLQEWFSFQPSSRQNNQYCNTRISHQFWDELSRSPEHYKAINLSDSLQQHKTIEIRIFAGTIQYWKVSNTLQMLNQYIKEIHKLKRPPASRSPLQIIKNKKLKQFYLQRVKQLHPQTYFRLKEDYPKEVDQCAG